MSKLLKSKRSDETSTYLIQPDGQLASGQGGQWQQGSYILELNAN